MNKFLRVLAVSTIVLSGLGILMAIISVVSIWRVNQPLTENLGNLAILAEEGLKLTDNTLAEVEPLVGLLQNSMVDIQETGDQLKSEIADSKPILDALSLLLGEDVGPKVEQALNTFRSLRKTVDDLNAATQTISAMPFINIPQIAQGVQNLADLFGDIDAGVDRMTSQIESFKTGLSDIVIQPVQDQAVEMASQLAKAQSEIQMTHAKVTTTLQIVVAVRPQIPVIVDAISLLLTVQLLWGVLAQAALVYLAWLYLQLGRLDLHNLIIPSDLSDRSQARS